MIRLKINPGDKFGKLTVVALSAERIRGGVSYECNCDCGKTTIALGFELNNGNKKSCRRCNEIVNGAKYNKLTVINELEGRKPNEKRKYECLCQCGNTTIVQDNNLKNGHTKSCGKCPDFFPGDKVGK